MQDLPSWISAAAAVGAVAAAALSWQAARAANLSTQATLAIEKERRHAELTPILKLSFIPFPSNGTIAQAHLELLGPISLSHLDSLAIEVLDDGNARDVGPAVLKGDAEQFAKQVWARWRMSPNVGPHRGSQMGPDRADEHGRALLITHRLFVGDSVDLQLEHTNPPPWSTWTSDEWALQASHSSIRFAVTCRRDNSEWRTIQTATWD